MRSIVQVAALFTLLFISRGECKPEADDLDYVDDGSTETTATISDSAPVEILSKPQRLRVNEGDTVTLPCKVTNPSLVSITWYKDGDTIYFGSSRRINDSRIELNKDGSLVINNFKQSDVSDHYKCSFKDLTLQELTHSVRFLATGKLSLKPGEITFVSRPNQNVTLSCIPDWEPEPKRITWSYEGKRILSDDYPEDGRNHTVRNVSHKNIGRYQCLADNKVGEIYVVIDLAPSIEVGDVRVHTGIGMESKLTCIVNAHPTAKVIWLKNGVKVRSDTNETTKPMNPLKTNYTLVISHTTANDLGNYTCRAANKMGNSNATVELTGTPSEAKFKGTEVASDNATPILEWVVTSHSPIIEYELRYRRKGENTWIIVKPKVTNEITSNRQYSLKYPLEGLRSGSYEAVLLARNQHGWSPSDSRSHEFEGVPSSAQSLMVSRFLILAASLYVYTTYL